MRRARDLHGVNAGDAVTVGCQDAHTLVLAAPEGSGGGGELRSFRFEAVLAPTTTQAEVMTKCGVRHLLDSALAGYTATVMCYGQTGSGKTFTMSGA